MTGLQVLVNAATTATDVGLYAYNHSPLTLGAAVFCGILALSSIVQFAVEGRS